MNIPRYYEEIRNAMNYYTLPTFTTYEQPIEYDLSTVVCIVGRFNLHNEMITEKEFKRIIEKFKSFSDDEILSIYSQVSLRFEDKIKKGKYSPNVKIQNNIFEASIKGFFIKAYTGHILENWTPIYPEVK